MPEKLASAVRRFRRPILIVWLAVLAAAGIASIPLPDRLSGGGWYVPGSESREVEQALKSGFGSRSSSNLALVVRDERHTTPSPQFAERVGAVMREVSSDRRLQLAGSYGWLSASPEGRRQFVAKDRRTCFTVLGLRLDDGTARRILPDIQQEVAERYEREGLRVAFVSAASLFGEVNRLSQEGLARAELVAFPLILIILLLLYRGVVAAVVSFVVAGTAIMFTFGVLSLIAERYELSIFVQNAATMIGLGVGVDYSLFIIARYADELREGRDRFAALVTTMRTSGETVFCSGLIIVVATASLFLVDLNVIRSLALGIVLVVAFSVLASLVVLPVVLYLLGDRLLRGRMPALSRVRKHRASRWATRAGRIMRRPVGYLVVSVVALVALAVPVIGLKTFTPDGRIIEESSPVRFGFDALNEGFGPGTASPIRVLVESSIPLHLSSDALSVIRLHDRFSLLDDVTRVESAVPVLRYFASGRPLDALAPSAVAQMPADARRALDHFVSADRRKIVFEIIADDTAAGDRARRLLDEVRDIADGLTSPQLKVAVGGETAEGVDANKVIQDGLRLVLPVMLVVIYLLLLVTFRSVLLPLKAILMNLLSLGATYGVLVLVFQHGFGADLLGMDDLGFLQNLVPIMLLAILFGLSTDYEVFLLNRVREEYMTGASNRDSVTLGMARSAPLISGAAVLMIAVFGAWAFTSIMPMQQLGFGLALAIALDATVIRLVVVPAAMQLMGRWNWWMPARREPGQVPMPSVPEPRSV